MLITARLLVAACLATASLAVVPLAGALAQSNPTGNLGSNKSATATTGTADNKAKSGLDSSGVTSKRPRPAQAAKNSGTPGATGSTIAPGNNSTVKGDRAGTAEQKTGTLSR